MQPLQFGDRQFRCLQRDRAQAGEAVGMAADDIGDLVVDRACGGQPQVRIGAVVGLPRRRRDRLDVDTHQVHVGDALLRRRALRPRPHAVLPVDLLAARVRLRFQEPARDRLVALDHRRGLEAVTWQWMSRVNHLPRACAGPGKRPGMRAPSGRQVNSMGGLPTGLRETYRVADHLQPRSGRRELTPELPVPLCQPPDMSSLAQFHPAVAAWFGRASPRPRRPRRGLAGHRPGRHTLIAAPTGSGKTLAAFLAAIDGLVRQGLDGRLADATQVVYVSPLKALSNDIQRNLEVPLAGIRDALRGAGLPDVEIRTWVRTGDTPPGERDRMRRRPPHILVTTPESLYILLGSASGRAMLATTRTVIVDEIHAMAPNKRGAHLALSLERLAALCGGRPACASACRRRRSRSRRLRTLLVGTTARRRRCHDRRHRPSAPARTGARGARPRRSKR